MATEQTWGEWPSEEERQANWNRELVQRYRDGLPLTKADTREARRLIRAESARPSLIADSPLVERG